MKQIKYKRNQTVKLGPLMDWRNGKSVVTTDIALTDIKAILIKADGTETVLTLSASGSDNNITFNGNGYCDLTLTQADTGVLGPLVIMLTNTLINGLDSEAILTRTTEFEVVAGNTGIRTRFV